MALTQKKKAFADAYIENGGNATQAAIAAGYSQKTAYSQGARLLKDVEVAARIRAREEEIDSAKIGTIKEIQEMRTDLIRSNDTPLKFRLRAASDLERTLTAGAAAKGSSAGASDADRGRVFELPARVIGRAFVDINRKITPNFSYVFAGGRGSGKSSYIALKIIELLLNNPQLHACAVRKVGNTLRDSVYAKLRWAICELGLEDEFRFRTSPLDITFKRTGQKIYFRGCDDAAKLKSLSPPSGYVGIVWKEELDQLAGEAEERSINQSLLRGGPLSFDFASYNPPKSRSNWVNKAAMEPNDQRIVHKSTYEDVPPEWLGEKFLRDAEHLKEVNPDAYEHEYGGVPNGDGGQVFTSLEVRRITDDEIACFDHIYQGIDWGWNPDPFVFLRLHYDRKIETIYFIDEIYATMLSNESAAMMIRERRYNDMTVTCDSAEHKSTADLRSMGIPAKDAVKGPGSVEYGMKWLQHRRIVIDPQRTPNAYREFVGYEYQRDSDGNIMSGYPDEHNHTIDACRYALERVINAYGSRA